MRALFAKAGFEMLDVRSVRNTYSVAYLAQLIPLPAALKSRLLPRFCARARRGSPTRDRAAWQSLPDRAQAD